MIGEDEHEEWLKDQSKFLKETSKKVNIIIGRTEEMSSRLEKIIEEQKEQEKSGVVFRTVKNEDHINIVDYVSIGIVKNIDKAMTDIFNHRKHKEGLNSMHNDMLFDLHRTIKDWHNKNIKEAIHIEELDEKMFRDDNKGQELKNRELFRVKREKKQ